MNILLQALVLTLLLVMDQNEFQTLEGNVGAETSEDVLMPDYEPPARISENADNGHNLIDMAIDLEPYTGKGGSVSCDLNFWARPLKTRISSF